MCPVDWMRSGGEAAWLVHFRCGECGCLEWRLLDELELEQLDRELDRASYEIVSAIKWLAFQSGEQLAARLAE